MLLENIFATALSVFLISITIIGSVSEVEAFDRKVFFYSVMTSFFLSGLLTIITAIIWIWRAWS